MLTDERIKEARDNVKMYLSDGLLSKAGFDKQVFNILENNANESLNVAEILYKEKYSWLWAIVTSYYAMYYIANAVLYKLGYKVGEKISHKVTADSLIALVRDKLKASLLEEYEEMQKEALAGIKVDEIIQSFDYEREKRSIFQYRTNESAKEAKAKTSLERAKEFVIEMKKLLPEFK
ncbi:HEPN domain-containing protein [Candidatus Woesearchaeota archaeon]|nr:HEPN domain-containing protein [Candidatus Woesearchaeota archaeon]